MFLTSTTKSLEIVLAAPVTTNPVTWVADYGQVASDNNTSAPLSADGTVAGATPVTMIAAPAASLVREALHLAIVNRDTVDAIVTVNVNDSSTLYPQITVTLTTGDNLVYTFRGGWQVIDSSGNLKTIVAAGNTITVAQGGTGRASLTAHAVLVGAGTSPVAFAGPGTTGYPLLAAGASADPAFGQLDLTVGVTGTLPIANGGTGQTTATAAFDALAPTTTRGDLIARGASSNGRLAIGASARILQSDGTDPSWVAVSADATIAAGGALTLASVISAAGPIGSATVTPIITFDAKGRLTTVTSATITPAASSITGGAALTKVDDTNVTLTLGGTPATSLLVASSLTLGWTGQLSVARGGTGAGSFTAHGIMLGEGTSALVPTAAMSNGQLLVGATGADPAPQTVSGSGATITMGSTGVITISAIANASLANSSVTVTAGTALTGGGAVALGAAITLNLDTTIPQAESVVLTDSATTTATTVLTIGHNSSGTPVGGFGSGLTFTAKSSTTNDTQQANIKAIWVVATHASRTARTVFSVSDSAASREYFRGEADGSNALISFFGANVAARQTGDAGTALVTFGLMSGTPTFAAANLTGTTLAATIVTSSITTVGTLTGGATGVGFTVALGTSTITGILGSANGGTANGFTKFSGPATSEKTFTLPNASATILTDNAVVTVAQGGTGLGTLTAHAVYVGNGTSAPTALAVGATNTLLHGNTGADPSYSAVVEADITLADNTTNNATTSAHGFLKKLDNTATHFMDGTGAWSTPAGGVAYTAYGGRLTLTTAVPVTTADVLAATTLYYTPYIHDQVGLYSGSWAQVTFTEKSILLTAAQTGTTTNGNKIISGLTDTSQLVRGMAITGTNVGAASVIATIDSATQVTGTVNSTGSASNTMTFKCPAGKNYDVFGINASSALKLQFGNAWTNDTTRADALGTQNSVQVNNAAINSTDSNTIAAKNGVYLGTIRTTGTVGQTEDSFGGTSQSGGHRYVWNYYNRIIRHIGVIDTTNTWTYSTATWHQANAATGNKVEYVQGLSVDPIKGNVWHGCNTGASGVEVTAAAGIGIDSTSANSALTVGGPSNDWWVTLEAKYIGFPGIGYHALNWLEIATAQGTITWYGDNGVTYMNTGLIAEVMG